MKTFRAKNKLIGTTQSFRFYFSVSALPAASTKIKQPVGHTYNQILLYLHILSNIAFMTMPIFISLLIQFVQHFINSAAI